MEGIRNLTPAVESNISFKTSSGMKNMKNLNFDGLLLNAMEQSVNSDSVEDLESKESSDLLDLLAIFNGSKNSEDKDNSDLLEALYQMYGLNLNNGTYGQDLLSKLSDNSNAASIISQLSGIDSDNTLNTQILASLLEKAAAKSNASQINANTDSQSVEATNIDNKISSENGLSEIFDNLSNKFPNGVSESFSSTRSSYEMTRNRIETIRSMTMGKKSVNMNGDTSKTQVSTNQNDNIQLQVVENKLPVENINENVNENINDIVEKASIADTSSQKANIFDSKSQTSNKVENMLADNAKEVEVIKVGAKEANSQANTSNKDANNSDFMETNVNSFNLNDKIAEINRFVAEKEVVASEGNYGREIIDQIDKQISIVKTSGLKEGVNEIKMKLKPENLGELNIKITLEKGNLNIDILAQNSKTQNIILDNISQLKEAIKQNLSSNYVNVESEKQDFNQQNQDSSNRRRQDFYYVEEDENSDQDFLDELLKMNEFNLRML